MESLLKFTGISSYLTWTKTLLKGGDVSEVTNQEESGAVKGCGYKVDTSRKPQS